MSTGTSELAADTGGRGDLEYDEMELTLGLPGRKSGTKRQFLDVVDLKLGDSNESEGECLDLDTKKPPSKEQVVGWPPVVRSYRKNTMNKSACKYVKVAVDGAPYLRKVNLESYTGYQQLLSVFEDMFACFTIGNVSNERNVTDPIRSSDHVPTYEDKDGYWMLVGDVPWKMFVETCKRIRLMKSSEAVNQLSSKNIYRKLKLKSSKRILC